MRISTAAARTTQMSKIGIDGLRPAYERAAAA
jgi:hypothetical protein